MKKRATLFSKASFRVLSLAIALGLAPAAYAQTPVTFTGTVYQDDNGLMDNTINGTPIGTVSIGTQPAQQIYVYLVKTTGTFPSVNRTVVAKELVSTAPATLGQYSIDAPDNVPYNLNISNVDVAIGAQNQSLGFPEAVFQPTAEGTIASGDGQPDYGVAVDGLTNLVVDFGIDARPIASDYTVSNPTYIPGASKEFDSVIIPAAAFVAFDQEDGFYPTGLAGRSVHLLAGSGGSLYYNGRLITVSTVGTLSRIDNFVVDSIRFVRSPLATAFSFPFATIDDADVNQFIPSTITINAQPLPVSLLSFEARRQGTSAVVLWSAPSEAAGLGFDVERSTDGRNFTNIGHVASVTESNTTVDYRFEDGNLPSETASGKIYYRLRQTDFNGQAEYSKVAIISSSSSFESTSAQLSLYPNPASNVLHVSLKGAQGTTATVVLSDATGRVVDRKTTTPEGATTLEVSSLPAGMYFVQYSTGNSELITERIVITR